MVGFGICVGTQTRGFQDSPTEVTVKLLSGNELTVPATDARLTHCWNLRDLWKIVKLHREARGWWQVPADKTP